MARPATKKAGVGVAGTRAPRGSLSRDQIVEAASRLLRTQPSGVISIRSVATELGVSPMAIYRHVRNKSDLLDVLVGELLATAWRPETPLRNWRAWTLEAADRLRTFLVANPIALDVYLNHPVTSPAAVARMETMLRVLTRGLGDERRARRAYATIHTYTLGFAALEVARRSGNQSLDDDALSRELADYTSPAQFREAISTIVRGYELRGRS